MMDEMSSPGTAGDLTILVYVVDAYHNVPPGHEKYFEIHRPLDIQRGSLPTILLHPGLPGGAMTPDWKVLRRLADAGFLRFAKESPPDTYIYQLPGKEVVEITDSGFEAVARLRSRMSDNQGNRPMNNEVWVVYGRNRVARDLIFAILRAVNVKPLDFDHAGQLTGNASPYIGDVLRSAFDRAQAFLVLFTDDEEVSLRKEFRERESESDAQQGYQPRPNVIFEAGMALGLNAERTVIVEMGRLRHISDLAGRHVLRWGNGDAEVRSNFLKKLEAAGCPVDRGSNDWLSVGQ